MRIISKKKYKEMQDLITGLQQDYNSLKEKYDSLEDEQIEIQLEYKYMKEQKELAEQQVSYLLKKITDLEVPKVTGLKIPKIEIKNRKNGGKENGKSNKSEKNIKNSTK